MPLTYKLTKQILRDHGFINDHQTGSHQIWKLGEGIVVVPEKKEFATGTARSIIKRIGELSQRHISDLKKTYNIKF